MEIEGKLVDIVFKNDVKETGWLASPGKKNVASLSMIDKQDIQRCVEVREFPRSLIQVRDFVDQECKYSEASTEIPTSSAEGPMSRIDYTLEILSGPNQGKKISAKYYD